MERPTLRQLEYALAVDEHRHFGRAAAALHVSQPGLSAQLRELERRLGVQLFERSRAATRPTPAGEEVLERARGVLRAVDDLTHLARLHEDGVRGRLRLAAIPTVGPYLLPTVVARLRAEWPDAELVLEELRTADLVAAVRAGDVDLGLLATPVDTGDLVVLDLFFEPFRLAVAKGHPLARRRGGVPLAALHDLDLLLLEDGHCLREHALAACSTAGGARHREVHNAGLAVLAQMVASSGAATLLPACAVPVEARRGTGLATQPFVDADVGRTISFVWRRTDPRAGLYAEAATHLAGAGAARPVARTS